MNLLTIPSVISPPPGLTLFLLKYLPQQFFQVLEVKALCVEKKISVLSPHIELMF